MRFAETVLQFAVHECLLLAAVIFCLLGIEDVVFDSVWLTHIARSRGKSTAIAASLDAVANSVKFAILVPVWYEARVIASMLEIMFRSYERHDFVIFVGSYPNDHPTQEALRPFAGKSLVVAENSRNGPTSKGDALNVAWLAALTHEQATGELFDCIVLHDAEDVTMAGEPELFAQHLQYHAFLQIPVVPIPIASSRWIAGHYCDEFAEAHLKSLVVRGLFNASIPSAGVGTAIRRDVLDRVAKLRGGLPFAPDSLTEDYELGLIVAELGGSSAFLRANMFPSGEAVCVRSRFPTTLAAAIRQKSRWVAGISFAGWDRMGWTRSPVEIWMRWRDRRALLEVVALMAGYAGVLFAVPLAIIGTRNSFETTGYVQQILLASTLVFMIWRFAVRSICTSIVYGWREGLRSIPRVAVSNVVAILATIRAIRVYLRMLVTGRLVWEKTSHDFEAGSTT